MTLEVKLSLSAWTDIMSEYDMPMLRSQGAAFHCLGPAPHYNYWSDWNQTKTSVSFSLTPKPELAK